MLYQLRNLKEKEQEIMIHAPIWVTLLIAVADENLDSIEVNRAKDVIAIRSFAEQSDVRNIYKELKTNLDQTIQNEINKLPLKGDERQAQLVSQLKQLNKILPKLDPIYAKNYYQSLTRLANLVANSDGGLFGVGAVSYEEAEFVTLPMINTP